MILKTAPAVAWVPLKPISAVSAFVLDMLTEPVVMYEELCPNVADITKVATLYEVAPSVAIFRGVDDVSPYALTVNKSPVQASAIPVKEIDAKLKVPPADTLEKTAFGVAVMPSPSQADVTATP